MYALFHFSVFFPQAAIRESLYIARPTHRDGNPTTACPTADIRFGNGRPKPEHTGLPHPKIPSTPDYIPFAPGL